jgi:hypothetical protein
MKGYFNNEFKFKFKCFLYLFCKENLLSSRLLPKNLKIKIYKTLILPVGLYGCETWSLTEGV